MSVVFSLLSPHVAGIQGFEGAADGQQAGPSALVGLHVWCT